MGWDRTSSKVLSLVEQRVEDLEVASDLSAGSGLGQVAHVGADVKQTDAVSPADVTLCPVAADEVCNVAGAVSVHALELGIPLYQQIRHAILQAEIV